METCAVPSKYTSTRQPSAPGKVISWSVFVLFRNSNGSCLLHSGRESSIELLFLLLEEINSETFEEEPEAGRSTFRTDDLDGSEDDFTTVGLATVEVIEVPKHISGCKRSSVSQTKLERCVFIIVTFKVVGTAFVSLWRR